MDSLTFLCGVVYHYLVLVRIILTQGMNEKTSNHNQVAKKKKMTKKIVSRKNMAVATVMALALVISIGVTAIVMAIKEVRKGETSYWEGEVKVPTVNLIEGGGKINMYDIGLKTQQGECQVSGENYWKVGYYTEEWTLFLTERTVFLPGGQVHISPAWGGREVEAEARVETIYPELADSLRQEGEKQVSGEKWTMVMVYVTAEIEEGVQLPLYTRFEIQCWSGTYK